MPYHINININIITHTSNVWRPAYAAFIRGPRSAARLNRLVKPRFVRVFRESHSLPRPQSKPLTGRGNQTTQFAHVCKQTTQFAHVCKNKELKMFLISIKKMKNTEKKEKNIKDIID